MDIALRSFVAFLFRRGGTLSISGVYGGQLDPLPMMQLFDKGVQIRMGQAHVRRWTDEILPLLEGDEDPLGVDDLTTHQVPLDEAASAYEMFQKKEERGDQGRAEAMKAVLINCTLKSSPEKSNTEALAEVVAEALREDGVDVTSVRAVDHSIPPGVEIEMGGGDEWPGIRAQIVDSRDPGLRAPTWVGRPSIVSRNERWSGWTR